MSEQAARWEFLCAWCAPVHDRLASESDFGDGVPTLAYDGMQLQFPSGWEHVPFGPLVVTRVEVDHSFERMVAIRDALVLLSVLARVDHRAYKLVLTEFCGVEIEDAPRVTSRGDFYQPRFMIEISPSEMDEWVPTMLDAFFSDRNAALSAELVEAAHRIITSGETGVSTSDPLEIGIALSLNAHLQDHKLIVANMYSLLKAVQRTGGGWRFPLVMPSTADGEKTPLECVLVVEPLEVSLVGDGLLPSEMELIGRLAASRDDCPLSRISFSPSIVEDSGLDAAQVVQKTGKLLGRVLRAGGCRDETPPRPQEVELRRSATSISAFGRLCSALAETQSTNTVIVTCGEEDTQGLRFWEYVAYAFFTAHARENSLITTLSIGGVNITAKDAEVFGAVLAAGDPVGYVYDRDNSDNEASVATLPLGRPSARWLLKQGSIVRLEAMGPEEVIPTKSASWSLENDVFGVRVLPGSNEHDFTRVLIPGFGVCTTARELLVSDEATRWVRGGGVTTLKLESDYDEMGALRFLNLVGSALTCLQLSGSFRDVSSVFQVCPHLDTLVIQHGADAEVFLQAYQSSSVQLEALECHFNNEDDLQAIAAELADQSSKLAKSLKRIACSCHWIREETQQMDAFVAMLSSNKTLNYISFALPEEAHDTYAMRLKQHHGELLPAAREPFSLACRLAFLSVCQGSHGWEKRAKREASEVTTSRLARFSMDRNVAAIIFAFAAERARRQVFIGNAY